MVAWVHRDQHGPLTMRDWIRIQRYCWPRPRKQAANHDNLWDGSANSSQPLREAGVQSHLE
jgi:hypothetical protein